MPNNLITLTHQQYYEGADGVQLSGDDTQYGHYQFMKIGDVIEDVLATYCQVGRILEGIRKSDVNYHAHRAMQELCFDTFRSHKTMEIEIPPSLIMALPHDYVGYVKVTWMDAGGIEHTLNPAIVTSNPEAYNQDSNYYLEFDSNEEATHPSDSDTWFEYHGNTVNSTNPTPNNEGGLDVFDLQDGRRFGAEPRHMNKNGSFFIDYHRGRIHFSGNCTGKTITLKYISDCVGYANSPSSIGTCTTTQVDHDGGAESVPAWVGIIGDCGQFDITVDTKVYIYYDGTSLGQSAVATAYNAIMSWLTDQADFTPVLRDPTQQVNYNNQDASGAYAAFSYGTTGDATSPRENVFHTMVAGERWIDWSITPMSGSFNNSNDYSCVDTYHGGTGGDLGNFNTSGQHEEGYGHSSSEVGTYSYVGSTGTITDKLNHWVGWGVSLVGTGSGNPSDAQFPNNFAANTSGCGNRIVSLSKPDGSAFNNVAVALQKHPFWPLYSPWMKASQGINWGFERYKNDILMTLTDANATQIQPVQMYDTTDYDTVTGMGPKGHSVFDYQNSTYTQPNTWNVLAEEANAATANSGTELETRAKNNCVHLGPPPVADPQNDDVLVIIFADESDFAYHGESGGENPTFNDTISSGTKKTEKQNPYKDSGSPYPETIPNYLRTHDIHDNRHVQPTPHYKQDILEFNERRAVYIAVNSKTYQCFMYPSEPTGGQANAHEALPLMALASIATGTASNGLWTTNTSPRKSGTYSANSPYPENGTRDKCAYSNLDEVETQNPYWDLTNHPIPPGNPNTTGSWGNLETKGWGVNTQVRPFTSQRFTDDILLFLGQGGTGCDGTQCILIRVIDYNEVAEVGYTVTINGVDIGATNSYGEILYTIPNNSGPITINDCYTFNPKGDCVQSLITLKLPSDFETVINVEEDMIVHKFAQEAMIKWIIYGCLQAKTPTDHNLLALLKKERFAETRKAKIRLSAIKIEEITQIMRGKSKWIKH